MVSPSDRHHLVLAVLFIACAWTMGACEDETSQPSEQADAASERDTTAQSADDESTSSDAGAAGGDGASRDPGRPSARSEQSGTITQKPPLEIDTYMTPEALSKVIGGGAYQSTSLPGKKPSPTYNARRFQPSNGRDYGAGLQVWSFDQQKALESTFEALRSQYLNVEDPPESAGSLQDRAFLSKRSGIRNVVFHLEAPRRIVAVSCGQQTCGSTDILLKLARDIEERIVEQVDEQTESKESTKADDAQHETEASDEPDSQGDDGSQ